MLFLTLQLNNKSANPYMKNLIIFASYFYLMVKIKFYILRAKAYEKSSNTLKCLFIAATLLAAACSRSLILPKKKKTLNFWAYLLTNSRLLFRHKALLQSFFAGK